jgi:arsenate reductase (thioredoxin)
VTKRKVLFLCTGNSCRSQMAEGWLRHYAGERAEVSSAGTNPAGLNPTAVSVMREAGEDISGHRSKHLDELIKQDFLFVITVCDAAREACPVFPGALYQLHWSLKIPTKRRGRRKNGWRRFGECGMRSERKCNNSPSAKDSCRAEKDAGTPRLYFSSIDVSTFLVLLTSLL